MFVAAGAAAVGDERKACALRGFLLSQSGINHPTGRAGGRVVVVVGAGRGFWAHRFSLLGRNAGTSGLPMNGLAS